MPGGEHFDQREALHAAGKWDQRPGDLDATRGLHEPRRRAVAAVARSTSMGWYVGLFLDSEQAVDLSPAHARALARELLGTADLCEGKHPSLGLSGSPRK